MRGWFPLLALLIVLTSFAGCTSPGDNGLATDAVSTTSTSSGNTTTNSTASSTSTSKSNTTTSSSSNTTTVAPGNDTGNVTSNATAGNTTGNETSNATAGPAAPPQHYEGEWPIGAFGCGLRPGARDSIYHGPFAVEVMAEELTIGRPYTAVFTPTPGTQNVYIEFMDEAYARIGPAGTTTAAPWTVTGTVPEGTVSVRFTSCGAAGSSVVYDTA